MTYSLASAMSCFFWAGDSSEPRTPAYGTTTLSLKASPTASLPVLVVDRTAFARCSGVSDASSFSPASRSTCRMLVPANFPVFAVIGSEPQNAGAITT